MFKYNTRNSYHNLRANLYLDLFRGGGQRVILIIWSLPGWVSDLILNTVIVFLHYIRYQNTDHEAYYYTSKAFRSVTKMFCFVLKVFRSVPKAFRFVHKVFWFVHQLFHFILNVFRSVQTVQIVSCKEFLSRCSDFFMSFYCHYQNGEWTMKWKPHLFGE